MLKPLGDRVIVEVVEEEEQGEGALTPEGKRLPMAVKVGDTVLYDKYAGSEVKYEGQDYLVLHEKDIMAIA